MSQTLSSWSTRVASNGLAGCSQSAPLRFSHSHAPTQRLGHGRPLDIPRARRRGVRRQTPTRTYALFDSGGSKGRDGRGGNGNSDERNGNGNNDPPQRQSLQSLISFLLSIPSRLDKYYSPSNVFLLAVRRTLWCVISGGAGFYAGNIVTLSFGALAINDVFAGVVTLVFYEVVTKIFYSEGSLSRKSLKMWFVNYFKMGVVLSCLADAIKLGG